MARELPAVLVRQVVALLRFNYFHLYKQTLLSTLNSGHVPHLIAYKLSSSVISFIVPILNFSDCEILKSSSLNELNASD